MPEQDDFSDLHELGDQLRHRLGGEFRRTAEDDELAAAKAQVRARTLEHVGHELLSRGDTVAVTAGGRRFQGVVVHASGDLMAVAALGGDRVDICLGPLAAIQVIARATSGGRARDRFEAESFTARLRELELGEVRVTVVTPAATNPITGRIEAVTGDHVMVSDDDASRWYIPLSGIAAVSSPLD